MQVVYCRGGDELILINGTFAPDLDHQAVLHLFSSVPVDQHTRLTLVSCHKTHSWRALGALNIGKKNHRRSTTGQYFFFFFFFFCIFTRLGTLTICSCNYFTLKTFSINPQSTLVYGLLYRQGRKRGVLV